MKTVPIRAGLLVSFVPCTNTKPDRYNVKIRDFPNKLYSSHSAPDYMDYMQKPQYFAELRLQELGLTDWEIKGGTLLEGVGFVFTL